MLREEKKHRQLELRRLEAPAFAVGSTRETTVPSLFSSLRILLESSISAVRIVVRRFGRGFFAAVQNNPQNRDVLKFLSRLLSYRHRRSISLKHQEDSVTRRCN